MNIPDTIPHIHFDSSQYPPNDQFSLWSSAVATHRITRPVATTEPFRALVDAWTLGDMVLTHSRIDPTTFLRTTEMIRADGLDLVQVVLINAGTLRFRTDGNADERQLWQGQVATFDACRALTTESGALECITCSVSRRAFATATLEPYHHHGDVIGGPWGRLMAAYLLSLVDHLQDMTSTDAKNLTTAFVTLLASALRATGEANPAAAARRRLPLRQRAEAYIDRHLAAADLSAARIATDLGASQSNIYRAFADVGGVSAFIRRRRLETIHARLNSGDGRAVGEVAREFGFVSAAHFSRAFRRQFGFAPKRARSIASSLGPSIEADAITRFRTWQSWLS
jgi:AraC-like DNA-binding protein